MNVQLFVRWCETATSRQRAETYLRIAAAVLECDVDGRDRSVASSLLHMVLDDPSPLVRGEVAGFLSNHPAAPSSLLEGFLADNDRIASLVARTASLKPAVLIRALPNAGEAVQVAIAGRRRVEAPVVSALAWRSGLAACRTLLANDGADLTAATLRRLSDRFGGDPEMRALLALRPNLPGDVRQTLVLETARMLQSAGFVCNVLGEKRTRCAVFEASQRATTRIGETLGQPEMAAFVEHLRATGQISPMFLLRTAAKGNVDLLSCALTVLSGRSERRVRALVVEGRKEAFIALARDCGVAAPVAALLRSAVLAWKDVATGRMEAEPLDMPERVIHRIVATSPRETGGGCAGILNSLRNEMLRDARQAMVEERFAA